MMKIYPNIDCTIKSPYSNDNLLIKNILWQGIHVCVDAVCKKTNNKVIADLPVGHAVNFPCIVNPSTKELFYSENKILKNWLAKPLLISLLNPKENNIPIIIEVFKKYSNVIILNCIDNYYGHALLKLLNAERHILSNKNKYGIIILAQKELRWLAPKDIAEFWSVDIPFKNAHNFYTKLNKTIQTECKRFQNIYLSKTFSHPKINNIKRFTKISTHNFKSDTFRITFVWRKDRLWFLNDNIFAICRILKLTYPLIILQNIKIRILFFMLKNVYKNAKFTVAGIGKETKFPKWIDDQRIDKSNPELEKLLCKIYAESRLVIGVHGSNMLLPSAHAGLTIDLMPKNRWGNITQDIIFQEKDERVSTYRYRFIPIATSLLTLKEIAKEQIDKYEIFLKQIKQ